MKKFIKPIRHVIENRLLDVDAFLIITIFTIVLFAGGIGLNACSEPAEPGLEPEVAPGPPLPAQPPEPEIDYELDVTAQRLACLEELLGVTATYRSNGPFDVPVRIFYLEGLLGVAPNHYRLDHRVRLARVYGAAHRQNHDVRPCLRSFEQKEEAS